jgi:hypothetical protein
MNDELDRWRESQLKLSADIPAGAYHVDGTLIPMGLDRRRSWCSGSSRCFWELTLAVLLTFCDLLHLTEYLKGTFRFPYPPLV